jgi:hypothetical protein
MRSMRLSVVGSLASNFFLPPDGVQTIETLVVFYGASTTSTLMTRANRYAARAHPVCEDFTQLFVWLASFITASVGFGSICKSF